MDAYECVCADQNCQVSLRLFARMRQSCILFSPDILRVYCDAGPWILWAVTAIAAR
jgi:hypothetical protein